MRRLLLDQGLPRSTAEFLRDSGWDIVHVSEAGMSRASDAEILEFADARNCVVVTLDADFHSLLAVAAAAGPSVVRIRIEGLDANALAKLLETIRPRIEDAVTKGAMVTVTPTAIRIHYLPVLPSTGNR